MYLVGRLRFSDDQVYTGFNDPNEGIPGIIGNHENFDYYLFQDNNDNCKDVDQTSFFQIIQSNSKEDSCQEGNDPNDPENSWPLPPHISTNFENPLENIQNVENAISDLIEFKTELINSDFEQSLKKDALFIVDSKIDQFSLLLTEYHLSNEHFDSARVALENMQTKYKYAFVLSIDLYEQDFTKAYSTLTNLDLQDPEFGDFERTQQINIKFLNFGRDSISPSELNELYNLGLQSHPLSGFSRGLYSFLTDERFTSPIPVHDQIENRNNFIKSAKPQEEREFAILPNFTSSSFKISSKGYRDCLYSIYDLFGNEILTAKLNNYQLINASKFSPGTYIITVKKNEEILLTEKVVIL